MFYVKLLLIFLVAFFVALLISPIIIGIIKKEKIKQVILHYVESHKAKAGTPTMGGLIFIITIATIPFLFFESKNYLLSGLCIIVMVAYGIVGFLDDYIKFKFKRNLGLRAYQKILFQFAISIIVSIFAYKSNLVGSELVLPFSGKTIEIGWWIIPLNILVFLATTNSVNLTDGLDGLAAGTTFGYFMPFMMLLFVLLSGSVLGTNTIYLTEVNNILILISATLGAIICYLLFNCFPAKIFMGDTGSLALGALIASVMIFTKTTLYLPLLGIMFVASSVSVILQVSYYKLTKKRIFLMAPLHHHFEKKGVHEVRISLSYSVITIVVGIIVVLLEMI